MSATRRVVAAVAGTALLLLGLAPAATATSPQTLASQVQEQVLTWTAGNSITEYTSFPTTAVAGETTIVFENSTDTGNTMGMPHTLTFATDRPGYNSDVDLDILANPFDSQGGRHEAQVTLTPGTYYYSCTINGHEMNGELVVTEGGGEDTTPPEVSASVSGDQNGDGAYVGSATVSVSAEDAGSGVASVEYELDDTGFQAYSSPVSVGEPGDHSVQYRATDNAGNVSEVGSVSFTVAEEPPVDSTPPDVSASVTGDQNADGEYVGQATVSVSASDTGSGVASVEYALDGGAFASYSGPVTVTEPGAHSVEYRATDEAGNVSPVGSVSFTVAEPPPEDTTPPEVSAQVSGDQDGDGAYVGSATVTLSATDSGSGVASVEYSVDGAPYAVYGDPVQVSQPGEHTLTYRATDEAGNVSTPGSTAFTVVEPPQGDDTTPPEVTAALDPAEPNGDPYGEYEGTYHTPVTVWLSADDGDGSGVDWVEYRVDDGDWREYTDPVTVEAAGEHTVRYRATDNAGNTSEVASVAFEIVPDSCPGSDTSETVAIGGEDTGVQNVDTADGCTVADLVDADAEYESHGVFVRHVDAVTDRLVADGVITGREKGRLMRAAARSDVGSPARDERGVS